MKNLLYTLIILSITAFSMHKYYVSVTEIYIKPDKLEIIIRTFPDDIENVLKDTYHINADLSKKQTRKLLQEYINSHFIFNVDNQPVNYQYAGVTMEDEFLVILLQAKIGKTPQKIVVKNTILQDMYDEQKNIVHFFYKNDKASFILVKQDPVAVYKLGKS